MLTKARDWFLGPRTNHLHRSVVTGGTLALPAEMIRMAFMPHHLLSGRNGLSYAGSSLQRQGAPRLTYEGARIGMKVGPFG